jgi:hypothetical protein
MVQVRGGLVMGLPSGSIAVSTQGPPGRSFSRKPTATSSLASNIQVSVRIRIRVLGAKKSKSFSFAIVDGLAFSLNDSDVLLSVALQLLEAVAHLGDSLSVAERTRPPRPRAAET